jgi:hypothetical protein
MFSNVRLAVLESPGALTDRLKAVSHEPLTFESVVPPPVDRQALPPPTLLLSTRVPLANVFVGLVV